jgi:histidinol-phosphate aminotransferase
LAAGARRLPAGAVLFLDEAYAEFASEHFLDELPEYPNVMVGRTFAKAYGLAAVRAGCVVGAPPLVEQFRSAIPPFSVNVFALAAGGAAIEDGSYVRWYVDQVAQSRRLIYTACDRSGLTYWPSEANFVLVRIGPRASEIVELFARRGIYVRDRSGIPGCDGCVRITAGVVADTEACVAALEELCAPV